MNVIKPREVIVSEKYEGLRISSDGQWILCSPPYETLAYQWLNNPDVFEELYRLSEFLGLAEGKEQESGVNIT